ncbi:MAG: sugar phosphate isomerase/epimerase [Kiritimatiellaeota bacterium]|nr:sugar phosphate isomerase/epimerase [Kiritimatiellota bacterium]
MKHFSRRQFLSTAATSAVLASMPALAQVKKRKPRVGVQLYSVRDLCGQDLLGTLKAVKEIGYEGIELAGTYGKSAKELKQMAADLGLVFCGTHSGLDSIKPANLSKTLDYYSEMGNTYVTVPHMNADTAQGWIDFAKVFMDAVETAKKAGIRIGYHNHQHEFKDKFEGVSKFQIFFDHVSPEINMQLDVGHVVSAGDDPVAWLKKYPKRAYTVHAKEVYPGKGILGQPGEGRKGVDWDGVFAFCESDVTEWYIVETEADPKSIENVRGCFEYLKAKGRA